jgi:hypothetical protein
MNALQALLLALAAAGPGQSRSSSPQVTPADTFLDATARDLVLRAAARRDEAAEGLASYETTMTERMRVGVQFGLRLSNRSRTFYHKERVARARWSRGEDVLVKWLGRREGNPAFRDLPFGLGLDLAEALDLDNTFRQVPFDPSDDRIDFFKAGWIQPVSPAGLGQYRFRSGDTIRLGLSPPNRSLALVEVVVEPRVRRWETLEGSLWFDAETGDLSRAVFRPSGVWNHEEHAPEGTRDLPPSLVMPGIGTVEVVALEYALFEGRWWLPWRLAAKGVYDWGHGLARMPLEIEWTMRDFALNEAPTQELDNALDLSAASSISTIRRNAQNQRTIYVTPRGVDLTRAPELPPPLGEEPLDFTAEEFHPLLQSFSPLGPSPSLGRTVLSGLRYERVRGLSAGGERSWLLKDREVRLTFAARLGLSEHLAPSGEVEIARGVWGLAAYRELADAGGLVNPLGFVTSLNALLLGQDEGDYFWRTGGRVEATWGDAARQSLTLSAFGERQEPADVHARFSLGGDLRPNIAAQRLDAFGVAWDARVQRGDDPRGGVITGRVWGEGAGGSTPYWRTLATVSVVGGIGGIASMALSGTLGLASPDAPLQRWLFLGGTHSLRGFEGGSFRGTGAWFARAEVGTLGEGIRGVLFADVGWAGPREELTDHRPGVSAGLGLSLMDGLLRFDLARGVVRGKDWRVHLYLDGLF